MAATYDEPSGDATALPYWLLARFAAGHVKAVLTGEGADELFGGLSDLRRRSARRRRGPRRGGARARGRALAELVGPPSLDFRLRRLALGAGLGPLERHHAFKETFAPALRFALLGRAGDPLAALRARYAETAGAEPIARLQDADIGSFLADDLLPQADRAGMAHGLEVRVPFLDPEVAELAYALPLERACARLRDQAGAAPRRGAAAAAGDRARAQARLLHAGRGLAARAAGGARARPAGAGAGRRGRAGSRPRRCPRCWTATSTAARISAARCGR